MNQRENLEDYLKDYWRVDERRRANQSQNEQVKLEGEEEAAAEENRTAERRKGKLRKIHHRGSLDRTRVQPDVVEHAGLETQKGVRACG